MGGTVEHFTYGPDEFATFIAAHPFAGLGVDMATVRALCEGDRDAERAIDAAILPIPKHGTNQHGGVDNVNSSTGGGNSREYSLRRLKRDRPDLAEMVISGELSANAAAIEAGFRKRDTPLDTLRRAWGKATEGERAAFLAEIGVG